VCLLLILSNKLDLNQETRFTIQFTRMERSAEVKHSNLMGPFMNYGDKEVFRIWPMRQIS
jgi:hypothetical protein